MAGTLGSGSELNMRLGTSGTYTSLLEPGVGCDTVAVNLDRDSRVVPGGGNYEVTEVIDQVEGVVSFTVDENDTTRPLFWGKGLRRFSFEWTPNGGSQVSGEAVATIVHTYEERGPRRFAVTLAVDGDTT